MITKSKLRRAIELCQEQGVNKLILFGSAADDLRTARDLDFGVEGISGWEIIKLAARIEMEIGVDVDMVDLQKDSEFIRHIKEKGNVLYDIDGSYNRE